MQPSLLSVFTGDSEGRMGLRMARPGFPDHPGGSCLGCLCAAFLIAFVALYCDNVAVFAYKTINPIRAGSRLIQQMA